MADVGAQLSARFDRDRAGVLLRTLSNKNERNQALDIFSKIIQYPEFPKNALKREKARVISGLKEAKTKPGYIARRTLNNMLYGIHPYGLRSSGEVDTLNGLQRNDLVDFYQTNYSAVNSVIVAAPFSNDKPFAKDKLKSFVSNDFFLLILLL